MTDGRAIAYSERERELTFAKTDACVKCNYTGPYANVYYYSATQQCVLYCFVTNPKNLPAIFLYHILIVASMQPKAGLSK